MIRSIEYKIQVQKDAAWYRPWHTLVTTASLTLAYAYREDYQRLLGVHVRIRRVNSAKVAS